MSELYINKKIDSLGRIVIPKEIRKKLRILENENIDISLDNDTIIMKKSSEDLFDKKMFEIVRESIKKILNIELSLFTINKVYYGKIKLSDAEFKDFLINRKINFENIKVYPLYPNGILYGGLLVEKETSKEYNLIFECFKTFIEKYLED